MSWQIPSYMQKRDPQTGEGGPLAAQETWRSNLQPQAPMVDMQDLPRLAMKDALKDSLKQFTTTRPGTPTILPPGQKPVADPNAAAAPGHSDIGQALSESTGYNLFGSDNPVAGIGANLASGGWAGTINAVRGFGKNKGWW